MATELDNQISEILRIITEQGTAAPTPFPAVDWDTYYNNARNQTQQDFERHDLVDLNKNFGSRGINPTSGLATKGRMEARDRVLTPRLAALDNQKLAAVNNYNVQKAQYEQNSYVNRLNALLKSYALQQAIADRKKAEEEAARTRAMQGGFSAPPGVAIGSIVGGSPQPSTPGAATWQGSGGPGPNSQIQTQPAAAATSPAPSYGANGGAYVPIWRDPGRPIGGGFGGTFSPTGY